MRKPPVYCKLTVYHRDAQQTTIVRIPKDRLHDVLIGLDQDKWHIKSMEYYP
jgi:hypothetical protein